MCREYRRDGDDFTTMTVTMTVTMLSFVGGR